MANENRYSIVAVFVVFSASHFSLVCLLPLVFPYFLLFHAILEPQNSPPNEVTGKKSSKGAPGASRARGPKNVSKAIEDVPSYSKLLPNSKTFQDGNGNGNFREINSNDFQDGNWESMEMRG